MQRSVKNEGEKREREEVDVSQQMQSVFNIIAMFSSSFELFCPCSLSLSVCSYRLCVAISDHRTFICAESAIIFPQSTVSPVCMTTSLSLCHPGLSPQSAVSWLIHKKNKINEPISLYPDLDVFICILLLRLPRNFSPSNVEMCIAAVCVCE